MENKNISKLNKISFLYLCIPTIIFLIGWCKLSIGIIMSLLLLFVYFEHYKYQKNSLKDDIKDILNNKKKLLIILIISVLYVLISGIGGYMWQNSDHIYRNSLFEKLIKKKWPIINKKEKVFLVYYFAFWLPASLVGKILGIKLGYFFLFIWSVIGVFITFLYLKKYYKSNSLIPILIFIIFSGLDILEYFLNVDTNILSIIYSSNHLEWSTLFQFSSFTTQLFWVYNQCIPTWIITMLILNEQNNRIIFILLAMSLIFCTFPAIGLLPIIIYKIFFNNYNFKKEKNKLSEIKQILNENIIWENIFIGLPLIIIFSLFVKSNSAGKIITIGIKKEILFNYFLTISLEFTIYYLLIYKYQKKHPLYYLSLITLTICPLITINNKGDFCMRASIPSLIILLLLIIDSLYKAKQQKDIKFIILLNILLIIGSITPIHEIKRTLLNTKKGFKVETINLLESPYSKNFYGNIKKNLFFKYIIRK